jgi:hypothetical protein
MALKAPIFRSMKFSAVEMLRTILLFAGLAGFAFAQGPVSTVQVVAPSFRMIAGERMQLRAVSRDATGTERTTDIALWTVNNTTLATIEGNGTVTSRALGIITVTARIGNVTGTTQLQILPKRVVITPSEARVTVGQQMQFRAQALDVNDQPLPTATFTWTRLTTNGGTTNTSAISTTGMLSTVATGRILVAASINYSTSVPGFERQAQAQADVDIRPPDHYRLKKLLSTETVQTSPLRLRAKIVPLLGNDRGQVVFNANLEGMVNGPLLLDSGNIRLIASGGTPGPLVQTSNLEYSTLAFNNRGQVLALTSVLFSGNIIYRIDGDGATPVFIDSMPLPGTEFLTGPFINRNSLNDSGDWIMRANYRVNGAGATYTALFRNPVRGFPDEVVSTRSTLPDITSPFTLDNDFGLGSNGIVYFTATAGTRRVLYIKQYDEPRKLLATGDPLLGSTVAAFLGNGFIMSNEGDLAVAVRLANNQIHLLKYTGADPAAAPKNFLLRGFSNVYAVNQNAGTLFHGDGGRGTGIWSWKDEEMTPVFFQNSNQSLLRGKTVPQLDYAAVSGTGTVTILARTQDAAMELFTVRPGEQAATLLAAGDVVNVRAPLSIRNLLLGDKTGPAHVLLGGAGSSIYEISESGLKPRYLIGERFAGVSLYTGSSTGDTRKDPKGDIYVTPTGGTGIVRVRPDGTSEIVVRPPTPAETGITANAAANIFINGRGDMLWQASSNRGDTRMFLMQDGRTVSLLTNSAVAGQETFVDDKPVTGWGDQAIDENGRIMMTLRFRDNSAALYLWQDGVWKKVIQTLESRHAGITVNTYSTVKAGGDAFYAIFNLLGIGNTLVRYRNDAWETVIGVTETLVTGHAATSVGTYDVNRNGDVFAQCNTNTQVLVVKRRDGKTYYIHMLYELTPDGELLTRTSDYDIRDDGTVYFLGMTIFDEYAVYTAKPVN